MSQRVKRAIERIGPREAFVLLGVLVVVAIISYLGYGFAFMMRAELDASQTNLRRVQAVALAKSGVARAVALIRDQRRTGSTSWYRSPDALRAVIVVSSDTPREQGRFSVLAEDPDDHAKPRFGVTDEAGLVNVNTATKAMLMELPDMTDEIAEAILDWVDEDMDTRAQGAEEGYYRSQSPAYRPSNAPLRSVEELLLVKGVTAELLLGEDTNRNGILDPNEDDGDQTLPGDNADGRLDAGWCPLLTVWSSELNVDSEGNKRIDLNAKDVDRLHSELERAFGGDTAKVVTAFRKGQGQVRTRVPPPVDAEKNEQPPKPDGDGLYQHTGARTFRNPVELLGMTITIKEKNKADQVLRCSLAVEDLADVLDRLTVSDADVLVGLINVNTAPLAVLRTLPDLPDGTAEKIAARRAPVGTDPQRSVAWLVRDQVVTLDTFVKMCPYITGRSFQYRVQSVGYFDKGGPVCRLQAVVDLAAQRAHILYLRELTALGVGYNLWAETDALE